jgi:hypothetical protein
MIHTRQFTQGSCIDVSNAIAGLSLSMHSLAICTPRSSCSSLIQPMPVNYAYTKATAVHTRCAASEVHGDVANQPPIAALCQTHTQHRLGLASNRSKRRMQLHTAAAAVLPCCSTSLCSISTRPLCCCCCCCCSWLYKANQAALHYWLVCGAVQSHCACCCMRPLHSNCQAAALGVPCQVSNVGGARLVPAAAAAAAARVQQQVQ